MNIEATFSGLRCVCVCVCVNVCVCVVCVCGVEGVCVVCTPTSTAHLIGGEVVVVIVPAPIRIAIIVSAWVIIGVRGTIVSINTICI